MSEHRLTETDMRMALLQRGHTESQVAHLLGDIKADAWDEGSDARWQYASDLSAWGEESQIRGHNPYPPARPQNPYREAHDD